MTKEEYKSKIDAFCKIKKWKSNSIYKKSLYAACGLSDYYFKDEVGKIRVVKLQGSGKWTSTKNLYYDIVEFLDFYKIPYQFCNDAKKGGKLGNYLKIEVEE